MRSVDDLIDEVVIAAPPRTVYDRLRAVQSWPQFLPHVSDVSLHYDDSEHQAFTMLVDAGSIGAERIGTVQRCAADSIDFFHPEPFGFLKHHCGTWLIDPLDDGTTRLRLAQRWTPVDRVAAAGARIAWLLQLQACITLAAWKSGLERASAGRARLDA